MQVKNVPLSLQLGFPGGSVVKNTPAQCRSLGFNPWVRKIPWRRKWQPTLVFLPGKSHRQKSLVGYTPWGCKSVGHGLATEHIVHLYYYLLLIK